MKHILVLDVPSIKEYVFGTERLTEIRGASDLLDWLNRVEIGQALAAKIPAQALKTVYTGGGAAQFVVTANERELREAVNHLRGRVDAATRGGLRLLAGWAKYDESNYQRGLDLAFEALKREKDETPFFPSSSFHHGLMRECDSCSNPASVTRECFGQTLLLCEVCAAKTDQTKKHSNRWEELSQTLAKHGCRYERPESLETIGAHAAREGYLALVYADGNAMGRLLKTMKTPEQFRFFSQLVDRSIRESCHDSLFKTCLSRGGTADILLLGGDDLLVCLNADAAIPFAVDVLQRFQEVTRTQFQKEGELAPPGTERTGISLSAGVVFAKSHTPITLLLDQAEELMKLAKSRGSADERATATFTPSYLDFHFFSRYQQTRVADCRKNYLTLNEAGRKVLLYQKPYAVEDASRLVSFAAELVKAKVPRSRLSRLGRAPFLGVINGTLEILKSIERSRSKDHKRLLWEALHAFGCGSLPPWCEAEDGLSTVLLDLLELVDIMKTQSKGEADA